MNKIIIYNLCVFILLILTGCYPGTMTEKENDLLLTVKDLEGFDVKYADSETSETYKLTRFLDGSWEVEYEYDSLDKPGITPLYLSSVVEFEKNERDAKTVFKQGLLSYKDGALSVGAKIVADSQLFKWGDQSYAAFFKLDNVTVGNLIIVRQGSRIYNLIIYGSFYFDDPELIGELLIPKLELMVNYKR